ncbi:MAG: GNAT family N-acetyltransferase [Lachnospiraceae bacterium]|jgi:RimJ/RimL family protein N-acetyltransferase|nr:GNAT family N-acetyltransferase [Lachnospiraceae bacterium]
MIGNKVILRNMKEEDRELVMNLIRDPEIIKVTGGYSGLASFEHQRNWFCSLSDSIQGVRRVIADKDRPEVGLGIIILSDLDLKSGAAEIFIKIMKNFRGKGYGQDAVNVLVAYAFRELGLSCIYSNILEHNMISRRLFEKCGFRQEGIRRNRSFKDGPYRNVYSYSISNMR